MQFPETSCIITNVVTLIAVKREVAAQKWQVFRGANVKLGNWRQVTVQNNCPRQALVSVKRGNTLRVYLDAKKHGRKVETTCSILF
ncbi:hypothetical protein D5278_19040 [bacterium 1XD21-13]|nr:hypothetical protein [bacterium 1XD21-13]